MSPILAEISFPSQADVVSPALLDMHAPSPSLGLAADKDIAAKSALLCSKAWFVELPHSPSPIQFGAITVRPQERWEASVGSLQGGACSTALIEWCS